ncbi:MAG: vWA domain-containing protein [Minicystis sp.]
MHLRLPMLSRASLLASAFLAIPLVAAAACSATQGPNTFTGTGGAGSTTGVTTVATTGSATTGSGGAGGDTTINPVTGSGGAGGGIDQCASATAEAALVPVNIFITVDKSGSMLGPKWDAAKQAFTTFFQDPSADPLRIALRFWPDGLCDDGPCDLTAAEACGMPLVDIGPLSDAQHQQDLVDAWLANSPNGTTPTFIALQGATKWAAKYVLAHNHTEAAVVILVTDGEAAACNTDPVAIAHVAEIAYQGAGVLTFTVGMPGADQVALDQIAVKGHTGQAFMIGNGNAAQELLTALQTIQAGAVACSFAMPKAPDPQDIVDPTQVDVQLTPPAGPKVTFPQVASPAACGPAGGWYYDNADMPTMITLCPASCLQAQQTQGAKIEIVLGCIKHVE